MKLWGLVVVICWLLYGCSSQTDMEAGLINIDRQQLLDGKVLFGADAVRKLQLPDEDLLAMDMQMREFLAAYVNRRGSKEQRLRSLTRALLSNGMLGVSYNADKTLSAREVFYLQTGNCLAFSNLFVAMARELGIKVYFQQVDVPPSWSRRESFVLLNQHINVASPTSGGGKITVDFNRVGLRGNYDTYKVSDEVAFSQYYNNHGMAFLEQGNMEDAFRYLKKALSLAPEEANLWANLGALYSRNQHYEYAEAAYLQALKIDSRHNLATSNLARLYEFKGDSEKAAEYFQRVRRFRESNPYYHFWLAQEAFQRQEYEQSLGHLQTAIAKRKQEPQFYGLRSDIYKAVGDLSKARRELERAVEYSAGTGQHVHFSQRLKEL